MVDMIASVEDFRRAVKEKRITEGNHTEYPEYAIFKYTPITVGRKDWDAITMASRGLIVNTETGEILARPFSKFFNYNEISAPQEIMSGPISVTEKLDGSLGISYPDREGRMRISTAGGFQSEQGAHATKILQEKYEGKWEPKSGRTYMWEIIYPENRIVVNYGDEDDIHLIGAVDIRTGKSIPASQVEEWKWKRPAEYTKLTDLNQVISSPDRENHEGFIVHYTDTDARVKFKHDEYLNHHRYATGITSRKIWENMKLEVDDSEWVNNAPEEFESYIKDTKQGILSNYQKEESRIMGAYQSFVKTIPESISRKDFASALNTSGESKEDIKHFFMVKSGQGPVKKIIWEKIKPEAEMGFWHQNN